MGSIDQSRLPNSRPATPNRAVSSQYDLICIGFGPAQIATAIANHESQSPSKILFVEKKPAFSWKPDAHLPRTRMENAFVYDLATMRNPRSGFTYTNYLLARNRLIAFANSDRLQPLREEFEDYLKWCAEHFTEQVQYGHEVLSVTPDRSEGAVNGWQVVVRGPFEQTQTLRTKNIAAPSPAKRDHGVQPLTSVNFEKGQRIVAFDDYLAQRNRLREAREPRLDIAVVGSSDKAVEIVNDLLSCSKLGNVTVVTENEMLAPLQILDDEPATPQPRLCSIWEKPSQNSSSNISEASELVQSIYDRAYEKQVASNGRYTLRIIMARDGRSVADSTARAGIIISENASKAQLASGALFDGVDSLVLGCRQKGESLEEVQFKRGAVAEDCRMWMLNAHSNNGLSLAKDVAVRAGEIARMLAMAADGSAVNGDRPVMISARM